MSAIPAWQLPDLEISWKFTATFQFVPALFNEMTLRKREQAGIMIILHFKQNDLRLPGESYFDSTVRGSRACWQADSQHCAWQREQCSTEAPRQAAVLLDVTHTAGVQGTRSCRAETSEVWACHQGQMRHLVQAHPSQTSGASWDQEASGNEEGSPSARLLEYPTELQTKYPIPRL